MIRKIEKKKSGFTLVELIVVIVVIGLLAAMALPKFGSLTDEAKKSTSAMTKSATESRNECRSSANAAGRDANTLCGTETGQTYGGNS